MTACLGQQRENTLDRVHLGSKLRQHGGLIAAAGADLQHAFERAVVSCQLTHACDDPWLRYRLTVPDRERSIVVGTNGERFIHEDVAWHRVHGIEHKLVPDSLFTYPFDHPGA